ncbi:MAG: YlcI/YnfO family protein [Nostoc sp.]
MEREALTILFPADLLVKAKKIKEGSESLNDLVVEALEREVSRQSPQGMGCPSTDNCPQRNC